MTPTEAAIAADKARAAAEAGEELEETDPTAPLSLAIVGIGLVAGVFLAYALNYTLAHLADAPALPGALLAGGVGLLWALGVAAALAPAYEATLVPPVVSTRTV